MKIRSSLLLVIISFFAILLTGCAEKYATKKFKHNTPLIKQDVKILGKKELEKSAEMGPMPVEGDVIKLKKESNYHQSRKKLSPNIR